MPEETLRQMKRVGRNQVRATVGLAIAALILAAVSVGLVVGVSVLNGKINELQRGDTPASINRRQDSAETRYILCSRSASVVDPAKQAELVALCEGYDTLEHAYESQGVPPR